MLKFLQKGRNCVWEIKNKQFFIKLIYALSEEDSQECAPRFPRREGEVALCWSMTDPFSGATDLRKFVCGRWVRAAQTAVKPAFLKNCFE